MIEPGKGSEQVAQKGGLMRGAFAWHAAHKYSVASMEAEQAAHAGG